MSITCVLSMCIVHKPHFVSTLVVMSKQLPFMHPAITSLPTYWVLEKSHTQCIPTLSDYTIYIISVSLQKITHFSQYVQNICQSLPVTHFSQCIIACHKFQSYQHECFKSIKCFLFILTPHDSLEIKSKNVHGIFEGKNMGSFRFIQHNENSVHKAYISHPEV